MSKARAAFRKHYPIEIQRPQWPDWVDNDMHNILQKVSRGQRVLGSVSASTTWHRRSAGQGHKLLQTRTHHFPISYVLSFHLSLHLSAALAHVAGYTLTSTDGKQITSHIKGLLSVHGHTHTCTSTQSLTQDNRAFAGARGWGFRELRIEEGWGSMALPHTKAALK